MAVNRPSRKPLCASATRRSVLAGGLAALALPACRASDAGFDAEVLVLGAGLAGLNAAMWLAEDGRDVMVLEGSDRIGGRLHTMQHEGGYTEAGGEQIGASYARLLHRADQLGVETRTEEGPPPATTHVLDGQLLSPEDWRAANPLGLEGPQSGATPGAALFRLAAAVNPLESAQDWLALENDPSLASLLENAGIDPQARALLGHALNGNSLESYSAANLWRSLQLYAQSRGMGPSRAVVGGAQTLPVAMAASLSRPVTMNADIAAISVQAGSVRVETKDGRTFRAPHAVCALPFGALRHIALDAPVSAAQREAIDQLPYTQIVQLHFRILEPFWEQDGLPANMWTDTPYERVFIGTDTDGGPTGFGRCWINGSDAGAVDLSRFGEVMAAVRPSMAGATQPITEIRWTHEDSRPGGAYMHFAPGQIARWADVMGASAGRLHFAGEHLGRLATGMEAAMESGESAAFRLMGV